MDHRIRLKIFDPNRNRIWQTERSRPVSSEGHGNFGVAATTPTRFRRSRITPPTLSSVVSSTGDRLRAFFIFPDITVCKTSIYQFYSLSIVETTTERYGPNTGYLIYTIPLALSLPSTFKLLHTTKPNNFFPTSAMNFLNY